LFFYSHFLWAFGSVLYAAIIHYILRVFRCFHGCGETHGCLLLLQLRYTVLIVRTQPWFDMLLRHAALVQSLGRRFIHSVGTFGGTLPLLRACCGLLRACALLALPAPRLAAPAGSPTYRIPRDANRCRAITVRRLAPPLPCRGMRACAHAARRTASVLPFATTSLPLYYAVALGCLPTLPFRYRAPLPAGWICPWRRSRAAACRWDVFSLTLVSIWYATSRFGGRW